VGVERIRGSAVITVQNGGPAIPPEFLPRIFEPFHRPADQIRSTGLGLGLFIAERIVVAHGGKIDVRSNEREGTTFTIRLPLLPGSASTISPSLLSPGPSVPETGPLLRP
jgi:sigma-B regulation protein RsbU (phosphoserine phosphatase)